MVLLFTPYMQYKKSVKSNKKASFTKKETQSFVYIQSITYSQKNIKNRTADEISIHLGTTTTSFFRK